MTTATISLEDARLARPMRAALLATAIHVFVAAFAVVFSLAHCAAVVAVWAAGEHQLWWLATRLVLGFAITLPAAAMLASWRALRRGRDSGLAPLASTMALLLVSIAQTIRYEATFPALFSLAAAIDLGALFAWRRTRATPRPSTFRLIGWALLPMVALLLVAIAFGLSAAEIDP